LSPNPAAKTLWVPAGPPLIMFIDALKNITKDLIGIDLLEVKVAEEKALEKELRPTEEFRFYEDEIKKLRIDAEKLRDEEVSRFENKLVKERELDMARTKSHNQIKVSL
jgi:hypothetical protein